MKELVFIGDSLTEYFDWQSRFPAYKVRNLGVSGEPVEALFERLRRTKLMPAPDYIFVMTGINNLWLEQHDILPLYEKVLDCMRHKFAGAEIVVQSILPVLMLVEPDLIVRINHSLRTMASACSMHYLDVHSQFFCADGELIRSYLEGDGVHLTDEGYAAWSGVIEKLLAARDNRLCK